MIYKASENCPILPSDRNMITCNNNICYVNITDRNSFHLPPPPPRSTLVKNFVFLKIFYFKYCFFLMKKKPRRQKYVWNDHQTLFDAALRQGPFKYICF
jgi:hypothetical protein